VGGIYKSQGGVAEADAAARNAEANARLSRQQTSANEDRLRFQNALKLGQQRASAAQSGFDPSSGSLLDLQGKSAGQLELDALTQRYEGNLRSTSLENEAQTYRSRATSARRSGFLNAFGSVFQAGGSYFGQPRVGGLAPVETRKI
jgi:hypothetical protein